MADSRCEWCGTPVDEGDYQDDGYRHTDGRCVEYLKAALGAANREVERLRKALDAPSGYVEHFTAGWRQGLERAAEICDREMRACEHHMFTVQQIGHDGKHHKAAAQVVRDCAVMIRRLKGSSK